MKGSRMANGERVGKRVDSSTRNGKKVFVDFDPGRGSRRRPFSDRRIEITQRRRP